MNTITAASLSNGFATTASTSTILAIDLGKYKSVACLHHPDSGEFRFTTFDTSGGELGCPFQICDCDYFFRLRVIRG